MASAAPPQKRRSLCITDTKVPMLIPLRQRPKFCTFFVQQFESEWPQWYGPGGQGNARKDLKAFANPDGNLPVGVVALDDEGSPSWADEERRVS